jgi:hypothetical protein
VHSKVEYSLYSRKSAPEVINILEQSRRRKQRILITYGNPKSGKVDKTYRTYRGHVSLTQDNIPVLMPTPRSKRGITILDDCILKIQESPGGIILYRHPSIW